MKHTTKVSMIAAMLVLISNLGITTAQAKPPQGYYYLICKGDVNTNITIDPTPTRNLNIGLSFRRSAKGYNQAPSALKRGECTFLNRPLNAAEPTSAVLTFAQQGRVSLDPTAFLIPGRRFHNVQHFPVSVRFNRTNRGVEMNFLQENPDRRSQGRRKQAFAKIVIETDKLFTISVKNEGGVFRIHRYYPYLVKGDTINIDSGKVIIR